MVVLDTPMSKATVQGNRNKLNIQFSEQNQHVYFFFITMSCHAILLTRLTIYSTCILDIWELRQWNSR